MNQYTFTDEQLFALLQGAVEMFQEQMHVHGKEPGHAVAAAANESVEGLIAERELFDHGELRDKQLTQVYPGVACPACLADYVQSGVENT